MARRNQIDTVLIHFNINSYNKDMISTKVGVFIGILVTLGTFYIIFLTKLSEEELGLANRLVGQLLPSSAIFVATPFLMLLNNSELRHYIIDLYLH